MKAKVFVLRGSSVVKEQLRQRILKKTKELEKTVNTLRELGDDWKENMGILNDAAQGNGVTLQSIKRLCKESNQGNMVKIGLTLIAFPLPIVIDDVLGWSFLAAGLIQRRIKNSAIYLEDVNKSFLRLLKELRDIRQEMV